MAAVAVTPISLTPGARAGLAAPTRARLRSGAVGRRADRGVIAAATRRVAGGRPSYRAHGGGDPEGRYRPEPQRRPAGAVSVDAGGAGQRHRRECDPVARPDVAHGLR